MKPNEPQGEPAGLGGWVASGFYSENPNNPQGEPAGFGEPNNPQGEPAGLFGIRSFTLQKLGRCER